MAFLILKRCAVGPVGQLGMLTLCLWGVFELSSASTVPPREGPVSVIPQELLIPAPIQKFAKEPQLVPIPSHRGMTPKVWVQRVGSGALKVLVVHGGPGLSHVGLVPLTELVALDDVELIFFDQLGCGLSDCRYVHEACHSPDFWTLDNLVLQIESVRSALNLPFGETVILAHSFGGVGALQYAVRMAARGHQFAGLAILHTVASTSSSDFHGAKMFRSLPPSVQDKMQQFTRAGDFHSVEYQVLLWKYYVDPYFLHGRSRNSTHLMWDAKHVDEDIRKTMTGLDPYKNTGNVQNWNCFPQLPSLTTPTLLVVGEFDTISSESVRAMADAMPSATFQMIPDSGHYSFLDQPQLFAKTLGAWLASLHVDHSAQLLVEEEEESLSPNGEFSMRMIAPCFLAASLVSCLAFGYIERRRHSKQVQDGLPPELTAQFCNF